MGMWWTARCYVTLSACLKLKARSTCLCACLPQSQQWFNEVAPKSALQRSLLSCLFVRFDVCAHILKEALCFCLGNERCLTEYRQCCLQWNACLKIPGPFHVSISRPIQLNTMGRDIVPRLLKTRLEDRFIVCCLALCGMIGNEWMDMISTTQASECHVTAELWLCLATCWGIQLDSARQLKRSRWSLSAKEDTSSHQILHFPLKWLVALAVQGSSARCFS